MVDWYQKTWLRIAKLGDLATDINHAHVLPQHHQQVRASADVVLLAAADAVANIAMSPIWHRIKRNPIGSEMRHSCGTILPLAGARHLRPSLPSAMWDGE